MAQNSDNSHIILKKVDILEIVKNKTNVLVSFRFDGNNEVNVEIPKGNFQFLINQTSKQSSTLVLQNIDNKKVYSKFNIIPMPNIPTGKKTCEEQEKEQWEYFKTHIKPILINQANSTCTNIPYCLQIFCNGKRTVAYAMIILPNALKCLKTQASIEVFRNSFQFN